MVFEHIRKLQQEYMDKFVSVDEQRPELLRFKGRTGMVKTVNMSGRALVEFAGNENIGWYDIDIDYLKVIDEPLAADESAERAAPAAKPAKEAAPEAVSARKTPAKAGDEKMAVDDILAAARSSAGAPTKPVKKTPAVKAEQGTSVADILAAARGKASAAKPKPKRKPAEKSEIAADSKGMSVGDILAAARGNASVVKEASAPEPASTSSASSDASLPTEVASIVAYCRRVDG